MKNKKCAGCGESKLKLLFSLGKMPPVNAFITNEEVPSEEKFPLDKYFCENCKLVQIGEPVDPEKLFSHYLHMSSASQSNIKHLEEVEALIRTTSKKVGTELSKSNVLEIGSNDGTLLKLFKKSASNVLGVDPAKNLAEVANSKGVETITDFFSKKLGSKLRKEKGAFDWVVALNVVAHTPDFISLLQGVQTLLSRNGVFMMEAAYVVDTILKGQFDTVYHEHVYCFSLTSLKYALERVGMKVIKAEIIPTQGTSIRVMAALKNSEVNVDSSVQKILSSEEKQGFMDLKKYESVSQKIEDFVFNLRKKLEELKLQYGQKAIGLGAPARGVVVLNRSKIGPELVDAVIDDTPLKQNRLVPGVHIPVVSWETLRNRDQKVFFLLSWNYKKELLEKLSKYVKDPIVLVPFPELKVENNVDKKEKKLKAA
ncbi:MAG: class I SAM-dependent methyltransferase [Bacteriovoracia bacterium]